MIHCCLAMCQHILCNGLSQETSHTHDLSKSSQWQCVPQKFKTCARLGMACTCLGHIQKTVNKSVEHFKQLQKKQSTAMPVLAMSLQNMTETWGAPKNSFGQALGHIAGPKPIILTQLTSMIGFLCFSFFHSLMSGINGQQVTVEPPVQALPVVVVNPGGHCHTNCEVLF